jgi:RHS repeat-associated protein
LCSPAQQLSFPQKSIKEEGYIFVYLSYDNASNNYVYFDDLNITHTKSNVIQYNEYYPFGLQADKSWTRTNAKNNFLFNGGTELNATSGYYDLHYRNYDAAIGRFIQVDPMSVSEMAIYQYAGNNPVMFNDPLGDQLSWKRIQWEQGVSEFYRSGMAGGGGGSWNSPYNQGGSGGYGSYYGSNWSNSRPGSGGHWSDGVENSDWNPVDGSQQYKDAVAVGAVELGGLQFFRNGEGLKEVENRGGEIGYYVPYNYIDKDGIVVASEKFIGSAQQDEYQAYLKNFIRQNFGAEHDQLLNLATRTGQKLVWWIDGLGKQLKTPFEHGVTKRDEKDSKKVRVTIHAYTVMNAIANNNTNALYHVIAHELVHASDLLNGNYDAWSKWFGEKTAHDIMEHHAFERSIQVEKQIGSYFGAFHYQSKYVVPQDYLDPEGPWFY